MMSKSLKFSLALSVFTVLASVADAQVIRLRVRGGCKGVGCAAATVTASAPQAVVQAAPTVKPVPPGADPKSVAKPTTKSAPTAKAAVKPKTRSATLSISTSRDRTPLWSLLKMFNRDRSRVRVAVK